MTSIDEVEVLADRYEEVQKELVETFAYVKRIRSILDQSPQELDEIKEVLNSISDTTEKAAHSILEMIEEIIDADDSSSQHLDKIACLDVDDDEKEAIIALKESQNRRTELLNDMLVTMSFQDLTCQTLEKASIRLDKLKKSITGVLSGETEADESSQRKHAGSMSGVSRLKEVQGSGSRQDMIDELLRG